MHDRITELIPERYKQTELIKFPENEPVAPRALNLLVELMEGFLSRFREFEERIASLEKQLKETQAALRERSIVTYDPNGKRYRG